MRRLTTLTTGLLFSMAMLGAAGCTATNSAVVKAADSEQQEVETVRRVVTGSRIKQEVDPTAEIPATQQSVRVVSRDEIDRTGQVDLDDALERAIPQIRRR
ncbi:MAG: hypothetical protein MJA83_18180 [Gammaproteobacteria bacterium]|nr:hypothetical protein [Gammaproteobacteria bacterium]